MRAGARIVALLATLALAVACTGESDKEEEGGDGVAAAGTVRILAGSELADMEFLLERATEETGVEVEITHAGTLDATRQVLSGEADGTYDAVWLATNDYLRLHPEAERRILTETSIMTSPVALGLRPEALDRLGWQPDEITWSQVHEAAAAGDLTFGMTDPTRSNSGYSALISVTSALSGAQSALTADDVSGSATELRELFAGQRLTSGSSGWLAEAFGQRADVDALVNYESVLLGLDRAGVADLAVVRPLDGVVTARYPLTTLSSASPEAGEALRLLGAYLRTAPAQRALTEETLRRPVATEVTAAESIPDGQRRELPYPGSLDVADALLDAYDGELRRPSRTLYLLDTSGSMSGERLAALQDALRHLTGADNPAGERFRDREEVTLMPFSDAVVSTETWTVDAEGREEALAGIRSGTDALVAQGETAVYASLIEAYELLADEGARDAFTSIVLMTDGENNDEVQATDFQDFHGGLGDEQRRVPVFTILFGDSDPAELELIAEGTGGALFDAVNGSLADAFREIRGYQ
ncbi:substrate-binding and VWA domain-containing protein [Streptomyces profundus]|uniref:substrate-binding and VWA domain-containing protein n=1 Tax=Streptomyces profundus TaxID=2867410 RepID=UPI001D167195|nr:substrate-binding and VWA domain-containing protein [Streptomyces sp. MA3_2.13]UED82938.1 substrate-binding and VWA domain-containing protein [Streptomyces sp. MA3_2.13]